MTVLVGSSVIFAAVKVDGNTVAEVDVIKPRVRPVDAAMVNFPVALPVILNVEHAKVPLDIVRLFVIVNVRPRVVVPPLIVKLRNVVNTEEEGNVFVASNMTVPVPVIPGVQVPLPEPTERLPTINVPPLVIVIIPWAGVVLLFPSTNPPASRVASLENVMVPSFPVFP